MNIILEARRGMSVFCSTGGSEFENWSLRHNGYRIALISAGVRPINNIVDITNYVMIETGQPLHAFDYDQVHGGEVIVRRARPGEAVVTLDGVTRACDDDTLLITDREASLALAGVMGGQSSEVTEQTTTILLESAFFDPAIVRRTSRRLGLRSEASNRFEKGVDPERIIPALSRAVQLLQEIAGGEVASEIHVEEIGDIEDVVIGLRHERLCNLLGIQIDPRRSDSISFVDCVLKWIMRMAFIKYKCPHEDLILISRKI